MVNLLFGIGLLIILVPGLTSSTIPASGNMVSASHLQPVYRILLRIHLGQSGRPLREWPPVLAEINYIWLSQAAICFDIHSTQQMNVTSFNKYPHRSGGVQFSAWPAIMA